MPDMPLPVSFRSELIKPLVIKLLAGESCSLFGVGSIGKGNVVRHLQREDVRTHYFLDAAPRTLWVYLDGNDLTGCTEQDLYGEVLAALAKELHKRGGALAAMETEVRARWQETTQSTSPSRARQCLEAALDLVLEQQVEHLILVLDDCDALINRAPDSLLRGLRALRDDRKQVLVYVTVTRRELARLRTMSPDFQAFFELFSGNMMGIKPYTEADAKYMLDRLVQRQLPAVRLLSEAEQRRIIELSGGHAGLLKQTYQATRNGERALEPDIVPNLIGKQLIWGECEKIWESLEDYELEDLKRIALRQPPRGPGMPPLRSRGLVKEVADGQWVIFSRLFDAFVRAKAGAPPVPAAIEISFSLSAQRVNVDGRWIQITPTEAALFKCLYDMRPEPCPYDRLVDALMRAGPPGGNPHRRIEQEMLQLREKVKAGDRYLILAMPDHRWRLVGRDGK